MPSLPELQRAFGAALLLGETADIEPYIVPNGVEPAARLRIYRNNARENFLAALRASFPVLERLVGADYFRQLACDYMQRFPSPSGNLHHTGEQLATYLERRFAATRVCVPARCRPTGMGLPGSSRCSRACAPRSGTAGENRARKATATCASTCTRRHAWSSPCTRSCKSGARTSRDGDADDRIIDLGAGR